MIYFIKCIYKLPICAVLLLISSGIISQESNDTTTKVKEDPRDKVKYQISLEQNNCEAFIVATIDIVEGWHINGANLPEECYSIPTNIIIPDMVREHSSFGYNGITLSSKELIKALKTFKNIEHGMGKDERDIFGIKAGDTFHIMKNGELYRKFEDNQVEKFAISDFNQDKAKEIKGESQVKVIREVYDKIKSRRLYFNPDVIIEPNYVKFYDKVAKEMLYLHDSSIIIKRKIIIETDSNFTLTGSFEFQTCDDVHCLPLFSEEFSLNVSGCNENLKPNEETSNNFIFLILGGAIIFITSIVILRKRKG